MEPREVGIGVRAGYVGFTLAAIAIAFCLIAVSPASGKTGVFAAVPGTLGSFSDGDDQCWYNPGAPRDVQFNVAGTLPYITDVQLSMTVSHPFVGDLDVRLIAPADKASHRLFGRTGFGWPSNSSCGDSSNIDGTYTFVDGFGPGPHGGWWQSAAQGETNHVIEPGIYQATGLGVEDGGEQPPTLITPAFQALPGANGTWILRLVDGALGDQGSISGASLRITSVNPVVFGKVKRKPKKGRAVLTARAVASGKVILNGKGIKRQARSVKKAGNVKLNIRPTGKLRKKLNKRGKASVRLKLSIRLTGSARTTTVGKKVKLRKKR